MFRSAVAVFAVAFFGCASLRAQLLHPPANPPSFEVATIKPSPPIARGTTIRSAAGLLFTKHTSLRDLIRFAWELKSDDQLEGAPAWVTTQYFDLQAKADDAERQAFTKLSPSGRAKENRWMLQSLLADRFGLSVTIKSETLPVYLLTLAKGGPKPALAAATPSQSDWRLSGTDQQLDAKEISMPQLADWLSHLPETGKHIVVDRTGLRGVYNFKLDGYSPSDEDLGASIFSALPSQLGLQLKAGKAPIEVLVINHAGQPSAN